MATQLRKPVNREPGQGVGTPLTYLFMAVWLGYFLLPLIWLVLSSTKTNAGLFSSFGFWFDKTNHFVQNLKDLFAYDHGNFALWMENTAVYPLCL